ARHAGQAIRRGKTKCEQCAASVSKLHSYTLPVDYGRTTRIGWSTRIFESVPILCHAGSGFDTHSNAAKTMVQKQRSESTFYFLKVHSDTNGTYLSALSLREVCQVA